MTTAACDKKDRTEKLAGLARVALSARRLPLLCCLAERRMIVSDIAERLELDSSTVSHALRDLKRLELVRMTQDRYSRWYSLSDRVRITKRENGGFELELSLDGMNIKCSVL